MFRLCKFLAVVAVGAVLTGCSSHGLDRTHVTTAPSLPTTTVVVTPTTRPRMTALHDQHAFDRWVNTTAARAWFGAVAENAARPAPPNARGNATATLAGTAHACGGDLPPCYVMRRESGGDPRAYALAGCHGPCYGKWQFDARTWASVRAQHPELNLPADPAAATEADQDSAARALWANGAGCSHWSACS